MSTVLFDLFASSARFEIDKQQVQFEMQLEAPRYHVLGDAGRLQQVLWNLLSNAIKFTPAGGMIELRTSVVGSTELRIRLTDSGRGIGLDSLERIFQPFEQGDLSVPSQFGGLGLGLAISKGIVDAHEGQIRAESPVSAGARPSQSPCHWLKLNRCRTHRLQGQSRRPLRKMFAFCSWTITKTLWSS